MSSELLGTVPHPNLIHAVAIHVRHTQLFFLLCKLSAVNWKDVGLNPTWHTLKSDLSLFILD